ncbi:MAG: zf-HC2 domain-containing protein [Candidatus Aminicenantes bacterium]|nr:zf-HC2 domain-containing protein [Candidatus Aminicenantes bacterium]
MRNCKFEELIDNYLLNRLTENNKEKFEKHYFDCPDCFNKMVKRDELISIIKSKGDIIFKDEYVAEEAKGETWLEKITSFLTPKQWAMAAASACLIFVIVFGVIPNLKTTSPQFFINEDMVRGGSITLISPVFETHVVPSQFEWKKLGENTEYKIYIYDNGDVLWQETTKENFIVLPEKIKKLLSGEKYSWQVKAFSPEGTLISVSSKVQFKINQNE